MKENKKVILAWSLIISLISGAQAGEYWITPDTSYGADGTGSGTASSPWVRSTATSFDSCLNGTGCVPTTGIPNNSTIHLMAGTFLTLQGVTFRPGWKLVGAGMDVTTVKLDVLSAEMLDVVIGGTGAGVGNYWYYAKDNTAASDMTVDLNMQSQSPLIEMAPGAVGLSGHNSLVSRIKVINWATTKAGRELFIINISTHPNNGEIKRNCVVEGCIIGAPAQVQMRDGVSAINITGGPAGTPGAGWIEGGEIRDCLVKDIECAVGGGIGKPTYFHGFSCSGVGMKVRNNIAINLGPAGFDSTGSYMECGSFVDYVIENNTFLDVAVGIYLQGWGAGCSGDTTLIRRNFYFRNNVITVKSGAVGISFGGYPGGVPGANKPLDVVIQNNTIHAGQGAGAITGITVGDIEAVNIEDNTVDGNGGTGINVGGGIPSVRLDNNRKIDGTSATTAGYPYTADKYEVAFTPASAGWYRLMSTCNFTSGKFNISGTFDNRITDVEFTYDVPWFASFGNITLLRHMFYNGGNVSKIRISSDPWVVCKFVYLDIYIDAVTTPGPLTVVWQPPKPLLGDRFTSVTYLGTTPPTGWDYEYIMDISQHGFHTVGPIFSGSANTQLTDETGKILTAALLDNAVTDTKLRDSVATSVIGRSGSSTGDPEDIQAAADGQYLRRSGGVLGFGTITSSELPTHTHAAADIISGLIATARLGGGTASSSTFLRGDQTWVVLAPPSTFRKTADQTINGNAYQDITGLSFPVTANTDYAFEFTIVFSSATATTGFGFSVNGPTSPTYIDYVVTYQTTANATAGTDVMTQRHDTAYNAMAATTATITAGVNLHAHIKGTLRNGANAGTLSARGRSELANNDLVVKRGSWGTSF